MRLCQLLVFLLSYSPDFNPIEEEEEEAFSKVKGGEGR
jgi:hypothetical protein